MTPFFRNKRLIILLVSFIVLVVLIGFTVRGDRNLAFPEQFAKDTIGFVQRIVKTPARSITTFVENVQSMRNMHEENQRLKSQLDEQLALSQRITALESENEELKAILGKTEDDDISSYEQIHATVIARNPNQWNNYVTINQGETNGVKANMAVMTATGLIGRVKSTSSFTATVQLLSDGSSTNRISAAIQGDDKVFGLIEGYDDNGEYLLFTSIPSDAKIEEGQTVITSGLSGIFPSNLVIGTVAQVEYDEFGLTQIAYVEPAANFYNINHVIVIERLAGVVDPGEGS